VAGVAVHSATQEATSQLAVQLADASALHEPLHSTSRLAEHWASKLTGVQRAVQPPVASSSQEALASTSMLLQAARPACAGRAKRSVGASAKAPK
jgi:hypothetical protein